MRGVIASGLIVLAGTALFLGTSAAGERKSKKLSVEGELTKEHPRDRFLKKSYSKPHDYKMLADQWYRIEVASKDFDAFLRVEDPSGEMIAYDDDGGDGLNSRLYMKPEKTGTYRLFVTSATADATGKYTLTASETSPEKIRDEVLKSFQANKDNLGKKDLKRAFDIVSNLEGSLPKQAGEIYAGLSKLFAASKDPQLAAFAKSFAGAERRLNLPGNEMKLKATALDGKPVDLSSYRGKVVLVDFWATWCGPCVRELPNVKKLYEKYHERGFEVVGISQDNEKDELTSFIKKHKIPWTNVFDEKKEIGDSYGVFGIPLPILIDRDGKVVSLEARGDELERLLEKLLPAK